MLLCIEMDLSGVADSMVATTSFLAMKQLCFLVCNELNVS